MDRGWRFGGQIRQVTTPLIADDLAPLPDYCHTVQFSERLTDDEMRAMADLMAEYPDVRLRVYGRSITDLEFLRFFPGVRRFSVDAMYELPSLDGIRHLSPDLEDLLIGRTHSNRFSLTVLAQFNKLRKLYLEGQQKEFEAIGRLTSLEDLTLRSITLRDLSALEPLRKLRSLDIKLGGTRDLRLLPRIGQLEYVELWMVRGLDDVSPLAEVMTLEKLFLQSMKRVTRLPSFAPSLALRHVIIQAMKGITDLRPLALAPNLEILALTDMPHLGADHLRPFLDHPRLRDGRWGFGSDRKNAKAWDLLPLGPKPFNYDAHKARVARSSGTSQ